VNCLLLCTVTGTCTHVTSLQMLPHFGSGPGWDTLLYLETGQQNQPVNPASGPGAAGHPGVPPRLAEGVQWCGTRQTWKTLLRVALLLQDNDPDPPVLKDPCEDNSSPPTYCNMCTCSGNSTQERAVQDLLCLVDLYLVYLI